MRKTNLYFLILLCVLPFVSQTQNKTDLELVHRLKTHVSVLASDSLEGRGLGTHGKKLAKRYIADQFSAYGLLPYDQDGYFQHFSLRINIIRVAATNVVGYVLGSDPMLRNEFILVGAHYDHLGYEEKNDGRIIYSGADDNASGTAAMIELAGYFAQNPELVGRSIIFVAFDAEESGLLGAGKFISENTRFNIEDIKAMFSLDMVGNYSTNKGLNLKGIGMIEGGAKLALGIAAENHIRLRNVSADVEAATDTKPFYDKGIPAIHANTGLTSTYHKPEDTYEKLDYEGMADVVVYLQELISRLSRLPGIEPEHRKGILRQPLTFRMNSGAMIYAGQSSNLYPDEFYDAKSVFAGSAGLHMLVHVGEKISMQPEVLYDYSGSQTASGVLRRHSLIVPFNLHYNLVHQWGMVRAYPFAGVYYRYNFAGKIADDQTNFDEDFQRQEWGMNLGFGIDIMKVRIAYTWRRGLTQIKQSPDEKVFFKGNYFTLGLRF